LKWLSENGLSLEVCGRLCERVTPRIGEQQGGCLGLHRAAAIGMQGELAWRHVVFGDGVVEQRPEQHGAFGIGDTPADGAAAEDVEDDIEIEVGPFGWPHQFGDIP
jgi:hypothetical protein